MKDYTVERIDYDDQVYTVGFYYDYDEAVKVAEEHFKEHDCEEVLVIRNWLGVPVKRFRRKGCLGHKDGGDTK